MTPLVTGLLGIVLLFILLGMGMPIAFIMAVVGFAGFSYLVSPEAAFRVVAKDLYNTFASYSLSVIPMFVWMGFIAFHSGISTRLYTAAYKLVGHIQGGLAMATQVACATFGAICGSDTATTATIAAVSLPEMKKYGYDDSLATASVAAGGVLGVLIPPSVIFLVYGVATQQSISKLFIAGILPGLLLMLLYMVTIYIITLRHPELGPPGPRASWRERFTAFGRSLWEILFIFALSIGGLFAGWFTPTEAGAVGSFGVLLVAVAERHLGWQAFKKTLADTTRTTGMIMFIVAGAIIFGRFMAVSEIPAMMASWAGTLTLPPYLVMTIILFIYLILGCFIDSLALIMLTIPIFYPVAVTILGYDPIWFGVIIVMVVAMGVITPPVGMNVYIVKGIAKDVPLETIFKGSLPFLVACIICIALLIAFPEIATFLPRFISY